jgi:ribonuclease BN (tRNA processing enzyme)
VTLSITVLGSSGTYPSATNPCSGYLVTDGRTTVWLDCGPGTLGPLQHHVDLADLDAVVVTHSHPDHCMDLPVFRNALKYGIDREGLPVYGPAGTRAMVEAALGDAVSPTFEWEVATDGATFTIGDLGFTCSRTDHPVETMAIRIESDGQAIAYSADTGPGWSFERFAAPIDLAIAEATLTTDEEGSVQHLSGRQAGTMARAAGARRLAITHLVPSTDPEVHRRDAEEAFGGPVEVAALGVRFEL